MITGLIVGLIAGAALGVVVGLLVRANQVTAARTAEARLSDAVAQNQGP
jgi:gas vesicle protein